MGKKIAAVAVLLVAGGIVGYWLYRHESYTPTEPPPARPSNEFKATVMVPTLETPIPVDKSAIWCGAFQLAWNRLKTDVVKEPIKIRGVDPLCQALNGSPFSEADLTPDSFYAAAGRAKDGIVERIRKEMRERFPEVQPNLPEVPALSAAAYAYLAASLRFKHGYRQQPEGVPFRTGSGAMMKVQGFGVRPSDAHDYRDVYHQPRVLHHGKANPVDEVVVDLDPETQPHQILLAMMQRPATLAEALAWVDQKLAKGDSDVFMGGETLLVPEVAVGLLHRFAELEGPGRIFENKALQGDFVAVAQQSVQFRLDRGGAVLRAEAFIGVKSAAPMQQPLQILFDRPFLLLMKKRGAAHPYFAVWVDNAELLETR